VVHRYTRSNVDPLTQPVEMFPVSSVVPRITAAPNIECDCTNTTVVVSGDPYSGITTMTSVSTFHLVNKRTFFTVGLELPDETLGACNEPVTVSGKSYLTDTIDLATGLDLPGIGSDIELN
jgi:hypothetical protein